jgi:hypothetical protein
MLWRFDEFVHGSDPLKGIIADDMPEDAEAELWVILTEQLGIRMNHAWPQKLFIPLGDNLGEIRFTCNKLEYRVYGSFAPGRVFRMWLYATKNRKRKGNQATNPPNAIDKARDRKRNYELHGIGRLRQYAP